MGAPPLPLGLGLSWGTCHRACGRMLAARASSIGCRSSLASGRLAEPRAKARLASPRLQAVLHQALFLLVAASAGAPRELLAGCPELAPMRPLPRRPRSLECSAGSSMTLGTKKLCTLSNSSDGRLARSHSVVQLPLRSQAHHKSLGSYAPPPRWHHF